MNRVLVVGMLDSVHLSRWLQQFKGQPVEITLFPSCKFRQMHPDLAALIKNKDVRYSQLKYSSFLSLSGYLDFFYHEVLSKIFPLFSRSTSLRHILKKLNVDILHLIELQHAGYLFLDSGITSERKFKVISTNYGSDLVYYISDSVDKQKLQDLLSLSDFYSAECRRDYLLARSLGFKGVEMPLMPNAGGFSQEQLNQPHRQLHKRNIIYVKGYGGRFGLGDIALKVSSKLLDIYPHIEVVVVSLTDDLNALAEELKCRYRDRFIAHTIRDSLDREQILEILRQSIICIGASRSDGISTTFLEALVCGAVPIQTDTSCAKEWTEKGFIAHVVSPTEDEIFKAARDVLDNTSTYESGVLTNIDLARKHLATTTFSPLARSFYSRFAGDFE